MIGQCSKGWSARCASSKGKKCRCACGGLNHGFKVRGPDEALELTPAKDLEYSWDEEIKQSEIREVGPLDTITFHRGIDREPWISVNGNRLHQRYVRHSPTGMEFGYGGSGPADTALNILALFISPKEANRLHQDFKWRFVSRIDQNQGGQIAMTEIAQWIRDKYAAEQLAAG